MDIFYFKTKYELTYEDRFYFTAVKNKLCVVLGCNRLPVKLAFCSIGIMLLEVQTLTFI